MRYFKTIIGAVLIALACIWFFNDFSPYAAGFFGYEPASAHKNVGTSNAVLPWLPLVFDTINTALAFAGVAIAYKSLGAR